MNKSQRIGIVGIGGVGGYLGARLAAAYKEDPDIEIVFFQRGEQLNAIRDRGITLITDHHTYKARPDLATENPEEAGQCDYIIVCVKSYDLEESAVSLQTTIGPETVLMTTLNGIDIDRRLAGVYPRNRILPGCIYVSAHREKPGVIRQVGGAGPFFFGFVDGRLSAPDRLETILRGANIKAEAIADITRKLWEKFVFVSPLACVTSYFRVPAGRVFENEQMKELFAGAVREVVMIAAARGVRLQESIVDDVLQRLSLIPYETKTSLQIDFERGRRTELDIFTGYVVKQGRELNIPTPLYDTILHTLNAE